MPKWNFDLPEMPVDNESKFIDETAYCQQLNLIARSMRAYSTHLIAMTQDLIHNHVQKLDADEFEFYYSKVLDALMDMRFLKSQLVRKLKLS